MWSRQKARIDPYGALGREDAYLLRHLLDHVRDAMPAMADAAPSRGLLTMAGRLAGSGHLVHAIAAANGIPYVVEQLDRLADAAHGEVSVVDTVALILGLQARHFSRRRLSRHDEDALLQQLLFQAKVVGAEALADEYASQLTEWSVAAVHTAWATGSHEAFPVAHVLPHGSEILASHQ